MTELAGAVCVVTGAASGIGRASALAFAREGADVVLADIDEAGLAEAAAGVEAAGRRALAVRCDVGRREEVEDLVRRSIAWQGHCDVFFSNAGVGVGGPPHRIPVEDWEWILDVNLRSHIWAVRAVLGHMLERRTGHLVHTASAAGLFGFAPAVPYSVTKFAVVGLCEALAAYLHGRGVGVSVVCPLAVDTNIFTSSRYTPEEGQSPEDAARLREAATQFLRTQGIPPQAVAEAVVAAVREGRLYVFPHPEVADLMRAKWEDPEGFVARAAVLAAIPRGGA